MSDMDMDWIQDQMTEAKVTQTVGTSVLRLLEVWGTMNHKDETAKKTVEIFAKLALGHTLVEGRVDTLSGTWVNAQPGQIKVTDIVRVRSNEFSDNLGIIHNGRVGKVVGVRYGDIIVKTIDGKTPELDGAHYSPHMLEKLIKE
jgi:hypothetical protein